jgi:hypothetical protein
MVTNNLTAGWSAHKASNTNIVICMNVSTSTAALVAAPPDYQAFKPGHAPAASTDMYSSVHIAHV